MSKQGFEVVFAVGARAGFPFEIWALFASVHDARRHADAAAYQFDVFAMPVYDDYNATPQGLRPDSLDLHHLGDLAVDEVQLAADAFDSGATPSVAAGPVHAVGDFDSTQLPEVRILFKRQSDAARYLAASVEAGSGQQWMEIMPVYSSYASCPTPKRFLHAGTALSQLVRAK